MSMNYVCGQNGSCNSSLFYGNYNRIHVISERLVENAYFLNGTSCDISVNKYSTRYLFIVFNLTRTILFFKTKTIIIIFDKRRLNETKYYLRDL